MRPLGKNQLQRLMGLATPGMMLVVADDRLAQSMFRRGLTAPHFSDQPDAFHKITPTGLRALADALERGDLQQFMKPFPSPPHSQETVK